ncbi:MAG: hypothetical protein JXA71_17020 [Chitinispirillaceae bacterium]|nr:hypothetical protein [Chitinispirillaceae bacterium]
MLMCGNRVLRWVNLEKKTEEIVYWGMGIVTQNTYQKMKVFDEEKRIVLTVVSPLYNDDFTEIVNNTSTITHDNLIDKKRVKQVPVCTESQEYKTNRRSDFNADPLVSFGSSFVIYRESHEYRWLSVNNELDYIDHPLRDTLNEYRDYFATDLVSLEIAPDRPHAVAICHQGIGQRHFASVIQWNKAPAVMPVPLTLQKNEDIEYSSLLLSPSGTWAYFNTSGGPAGSRHFLLYLDPDLPGGCLPPFELGVRASDSKATWITTPEGFVMQVGEKMLYWDLSRFDPRSFLWE